jgi:hypothetical protein
MCGHDVGAAADGPIGRLQPRPADRAQVSSGMTMAARAGSGWPRITRTKGPSDTTTPRAPMAMAKARYSVSYGEWVTARPTNLQRDRDVKDKS